MTDTTFLVTGFGPFLDVQENPSGELALRLAADPPSGVRVRAEVLPVSFAGAPAAIDAALADTGCDAYLSMGVHRGPEFRIETVGRRLLTSESADNDGVRGVDLELGEAPDLVTAYDLAALTEVLRAAGGDPIVSADAGGYVCERVQRHLLECGARDRRPALFLHVPPIACTCVDEQFPVVRAFVAELARQAAAGAGVPREAG